KRNIHLPVLGAGIKGLVLNQGENATTNNHHDPKNRSAPNEQSLRALVNGQRKPSLIFECSKRVLGLGPEEKARRANEKHKPDNGRQYDADCRAIPTGKSPMLNPQAGPPS